MEKLTQLDMVLRHLKDHKQGLTSWMAIKEYGCTRLSAAIYTLKKRGYVIGKENVYSRNRYGNPVHFARYYLVQGERVKPSFDLFGLENHPMFNIWPFSK